MGAPRGDGHHVVVVPGFGLGDESTASMRGYLGLLGYRAHGWGLGKNRGAANLERTVKLFAEELSPLVKGGRKVSLIGHSLGGVIARIYASTQPEAVRQVITLGSPFGGDVSAVNSIVGKLFERHAASPGDTTADAAKCPLPVPAVAIFSETDGIVSSRDCKVEAHPHAENIEVRGSHSGLIVNPSVFYAIADRLATQPELPRPFEPAGWRQSLYG